MVYRIEHVTRFVYDAPVYSNRNHVRMTPHGARAWTIATEPATRTSAYVDARGNTVTVFFVSGAHEHLLVRATGLAEPTVPEGEAGAELSEETELADFCAVSRECAGSGSIDAIVAAVRKRIVYLGGVTDVSTRASEVFRQGSGVCQDIAHATLAALRQAGYRARYVAGYLLGEGAMHAWVEVMDGARWRVLDPTHDVTVPETLISVATGRDYRDTAPVMGSYLGSASSHMTATVLMREEMVAS